MIEIKDVTKVYTGMAAPALAGVSLEIERGEFVFLVGPSGAGKSTLIKLIFCEQEPSTGHVYFWGKNTSDFKEGELLKHRRRMGMVFQDFRQIGRAHV